MTKEDSGRVSSSPPDNGGYKVISKPDAPIRVEERQFSREERRAFDIGNLPLGRKAPASK